MSEVNWSNGPSKSTDDIYREAWAGELQISKDQYGGESVLYYDPFKEMDKRPEICKAMINKALETIENTILSGSR